MTPLLWQSFFGGLLIGSGAAVLLLIDGKIAGISGILDNVLQGITGQGHWRLAFLLGLVLPALLVGVGSVRFAGGLPWLAASGLLVGFGTRLGSGCTSGHGVCGIANLSPRSILATSIFIATAIVTVYIVRHVAAA